MSLVPSEQYRKRARELVDANADNFRDLLVEQFAYAMQEAAEAVAAECRMRYLAAVCLRLAERANIRPVGDEVIAVELARELTYLTPGRNGGNGWLDGDQLRIDLERAA